MNFPHINLFLVLLISLLSTTFSNNSHLMMTKVIGECTKQQVTGKVVTISRIRFKECNHTIKLLNIFAEEKIIFDKDISFYGMQTQLVIIAPIWEVIGSRSINLNGQDAPSYHHPANNGNETGNKNGVDGLAGLPGGSAGNFYGIADEIIHASRLDISAIGGNGGKGQNGGNGANGKSGRAGKTREYDCETRKVPGQKTSQIGNNYFVYGEYGSCGGRGGNGGIGGQGGLRGIIDIIHFSKENFEGSVFTMESAGAFGYSGMGGKGGRGGKQGETGRGYCCKIYGLWSQSFYGYLIYDDTLRIDGHDGVSGKSLKKRQIPKPSIIIENFPQVINEYKNYIRPKLANPDNRNSRIHSLYDLLNSRYEVTKLYDSVNLVDEFTDLEKEYFISQDRDYLVPSYTQLAKRLNEYLTSISSAHLDERARNIYRAVLLELEWLIAEKLNTFTYSKGHSAMTNITLGLFTNGITPKDNLIEFENTFIRLEAFSNRIGVIDDLIREANELINDDLKNVMQDLKDTLDSQINKILEEITILVKDNRNTEDDLFKKRKELKEAIFLKGLLSVLKAGCAVAAAVYPPLGVAAAVGSSALSVAESLIPEVDPSSQIKKVTKAEKMLAKAATKFVVNADASHQEVFLNSRITDMTRNMSRSGKSDVEKLKNEILKKLKKAEEDEETKSYKSFEWEKSYITDITKELEDAEKEKDEIKKNNCKVKLNVIKLFKVSNIVASTASSTLKNNLQDQKKVDEINDALENNNVNLKRLYVIEEGIYSQTEPMLENMFSDIHQMGHNMSRMSVNQKLIANWNVINTLEDVQQKINSTLSNFEASEEINFVFKKLFSAFNVITKLHDVITRKLDEIADATFLVTLHMPQQSKTLAANNKLSWSLAKLNKIYHQNYLKDKYNVWVHAFRQFSFPNGGYYLRRTNYPDFVVNENIDEFIAKIVFNIKSFNTYFNTEDGRDNFLENQIVESYKGTCSINERAFFVWRKEDNEGKITDILKGKSVTLVSKGLDNETDSLKFNKIGIIFTSKDPTTQDKLFNILSNFKVNLTHNGDSVYSFYNKNYVIETNPVNLIFYYPASVNEIAGTSSPMHRKFSSGDCILSPFATWTVELLPVGRNHFGLLEEFIGKVDLELIGEGQRFKSNSCNKMCEDLIEKTYKRLV